MGRPAVAAKPVATDAAPSVVFIASRTFARSREADSFLAGRAGYAPSYLDAPCHLELITPGGHDTASLTEPTTSANKTVTCLCSPVRCRRVTGVPHTSQNRFSSRTDHCTDFCCAVNAPHHRAPGRLGT